MINKLNVLVIFMFNHYSNNDFSRNLIIKCVCFNLQQCFFETKLENIEYFYAPIYIVEHNKRILKIRVFQVMTSHRKCENQYRYNCKTRLEGKVVNFNGFRYEHTSV